VLSLLWNGKNNKGIAEPRHSKGLIGEEAEAEAEALQALPLALPSSSCALSGISLYYYLHKYIAH